MAGIGFRLNRLLSSSDFGDRIGGAFSAILISGGPLIMAILCMLGVAALPAWRTAGFHYEVFVGVTSHTYLISMVVFGLWEFVVVRYLADILYLRQERKVPWLFVMLSGASAAVAGLVAIGFFASTDLPRLIKVVAPVLTGSMALSWASTVLLSACRDFVSIVLAFVAGTVVTLVSTATFGSDPHLGTAGMLLGYGAGQFVTFVFLAWSILREFGTAMRPTPGISIYFKEHRAYMALGALGAALPWIDKLAFWHGHGTGVSIAKNLWSSPNYDLGMFLATLSILPSLAFFVGRVETGFYARIRHFLNLIEEKENYAEIEAARSEMMRDVLANGSAVVIMQSLSTGICFAGSWFLEARSGLAHGAVEVFRFGVFGAAFFVLNMFNNVIALYFDRPRLVVENLSVYVLLSGSFAILSTFAPSAWHGIGSVISGGIAFSLSVRRLKTMLQDATRLVIMRKGSVSALVHAPMTLERRKGA